MGLGTLEDSHNCVVLFISRYLMFRLLLQKHHQAARITHPVQCS